MKIYYPINMKILGAHFQIVNYECTNLQNNLCIYFLGQNGVNRRGQTGKRTDRQSETNITVPPLCLRGV